MKTQLVKHLFAAALLMIATCVFSQAKEELHFRLSALHKTSSDDLKAISNGVAKTLIDRKNNADAVAKSLEEAVITEGQLKGIMPEKHQVMAKIHFKAIEKHHKGASKYVTLITKELNKPEPNLSKVQEQVKKAVGEIKKAEGENQILAAKTKN